MTSRILEVEKVLDKNVIIEYHIEHIDYELYGKHMKSNKWLQIFDWIQIYDKIHTYLNNDGNDCDLNHLKNDKNFYIISSNIGIQIKVIPLDKYYVTLMCLNEYDTIDKLLKIAIKKLQIDKYEKEIRIEEDEDNGDDLKSVNKSKENTVQYEYDPLKVGYGIPNDIDIIPYTPSKKQEIKDKDEGERKSTTKNPENIKNVIIESDQYLPRSISVKDHGIIAVGDDNLKTTINTDERATESKNDDYNLVCRKSTRSKSKEAITSYVSEHYRHHRYYHQSGNRDEGKNSKSTKIKEPEKSESNYKRIKYQDDITEPVASSNNTTDKFLKIGIKKLQIDKYEKEIRIEEDEDDGDDLKSVNKSKKNTLQYEYDPLKVGNGIPNDIDIIPYTPSKKQKIKDKNEGEGKNIKKKRENTVSMIIESDQYSPRPISMKDDNTIAVNDDNLETRKNVDERETKNKNDDNSLRLRKLTRYKNKAVITAYVSSVEKKKNKHGVSSEHYRHNHYYHQDGNRNEGKHFKSTLKIKKPEKSELKYKRKKYQEEITELTASNNGNGNKEQKSRLNLNLFGSDDSDQDNKISNHSKSNNSTDYCQAKLSTRLSSLSPEKRTNDHEKKKQSIRQNENSPFKGKYKHDDSTSARSQKASSALSSTKYKVDKTEENLDFTTLTLRHMSTEDLLGTFDEVIPILDKLYDTCIKSQKTVNFTWPDKLKFLIEDLIKECDRMPLLCRLRRRYQKHVTEHTTNIIMSYLLPEWVLTIFMKTYNFERSDATAWIATQDKTDTINPTNYEKYCKKMGKELKRCKKKSKH